MSARIASKSGHLIRYNGLDGHFHQFFTTHSSFCFFISLVFASLQVHQKLQTHQRGAFEPTVPHVFGDGI